MTPSDLLDAIWPALVLFSLVLPLIIVNRPRQTPNIRFLRFLERQPGLRMDLVKRFGNVQTRINESLSAQELAAVLLLSCNRMDRTGRFERLIGAIQDGWVENSGEVFEAIENLGRKIELIGHAGYTAALYKMGLHAARSINAAEWAARFDDRLIAFENRYDLNLDRPWL